MNLEPRTALAVVGSSADGPPWLASKSAESLETIAGEPERSGRTRKIGNCATPPRPRRLPWAPVPAVPPPAEDDGEGEARRARYALRAKARRLYPPAIDAQGIPRAGRFASCGYVPAGEIPVTFRRSLGAGAVAWVAGVARCHSVWACPCCAAAILRERRDQAIRVQRAWRDRDRPGWMAGGRSRECSSACLETGDTCPRPLPRVVCRAESGNPRGACLEAPGPDAYAPPWEQRYEHAITMLTLTIRHAAGQPLEALLGGLMRAFRRLTKGAPWTRFRRRFGVVGTIRRIEITHGRAGWHPHLHVVLFHRRSAVPAVRSLALAAELRAEAWLRGAWAHHVVATMGEAHQPEIDRGVDFLDMTDADAGRYVGKLALEVGTITAKAPKRGNRTPWAILEAAAASRDEGSRDRQLWGEYVAATKGHRCLEISRSMRAIAGLEGEDSEDVTEPPEAEDALTVPSAQWRGWTERDEDGERVRFVPGLRSQPAAVCLILESLEAGDPSEVPAALLELYAPPRPAPRGPPARPPDADSWPGFDGP